MQTPLAAIEWDLDFKVMSWNPSAEKIFGYLEKEILGKHASIIIPEKHKRQVDTVWAELLKQKGGQRSTNENITKTGNTLFCEWFNTPIIDEAGNIIAVFSFSRQEAGDVKLMNMQPLIKEALKLIQSTIPTTNEINQDLDPDCGAIKADPTQIHKIVMNLATNAYHAMEETGGELKVSLKQIELGEYDIITPDMTPGVYVCLIVADTGVGMDKILTDKIFDPFFTTKEVGKGTGMGLSVVHGIVKGMGGSIHVYSESDKGTEFHVYLQIAEAMKEHQPTNVEAPIQGGTDHILFVDDEEMILQMETVMLERLGYQVTSRTSSLEALEAFRENPDKFDMVITDMAMPNMSGDKLAVELTKIRPDIPVLLCTGFSETMSKEKAASMGIKGFLLKPIVMKNLDQKIREVLDK